MLSNRATVSKNNHVSQTHVIAVLGVVGLLASSSDLRTEHARAATKLQIKWYHAYTSHWNNCGLHLDDGAHLLRFSRQQDAAANWLKPTSEDGNVSPWQMVAYVNTQLEALFMPSHGLVGDLDTIKTLLSNNFPVIIEAATIPNRIVLAGWALLIMIGYDDASQMFTSYDSYLAPTNSTPTITSTNSGNTSMTPIVLYNLDREAELMTLLVQTLMPPRTH
jgi:hypothetical protein